jgi:hypothetical protein
MRRHELGTVICIILFASLALPTGAAAQRVLVTANVNGHGFNPGADDAVSGPLRDAGDLSFQIGCDYLLDGWDGVWLVADLQILVNGAIVENDHNEGYAYLGRTVWYTISASSQDRTIMCILNTNVGNSSASGTLKGSGPNSATVKIDTFIRQNWVGNPSNTYRIFGGDDRSFNYYDGRARLYTVYDVYNPALNDLDILSGPTHQAGLTEEYDLGTSLDAPAPFGRITAQARNDWAWDVPLKTRWAMADTSNMSCTSPTRLGHPTDTTSAHRFTCSAAASDPLIWSPNVRWDLTITLTWGNDQIAYTVTGCHSYFPAFEAYVNGGTSPVALFQDAGSNSPSDLLYGCAASVSTSGVIR